MTVISSGGSRPATYLSMISGVAIAWDICGACHEHVRRCLCDDGPSEPAFLGAARGPGDPPVSPVGL